jgi:hypothetical protein
MRVDVQFIVCYEAYCKRGALPKCFQRHREGKT